MSKDTDLDIGLFVDFLNLKTIIGEMQSRITTIRAHEESFNPDEAARLLEGFATPLHEAIEAMADYMYDEEDEEEDEEEE